MNHWGRPIAFLALILSFVLALGCSDPAAKLRGRPIAELPKPLRLAFQPGKDFEPLPEPGPFDWLASHPEKGQTFAQFVRSKPRLPDSRRDTIYLQPFGEFPPDGGIRLMDLKQFAAAFFGMNVKLQPFVLLETTGAGSRINTQSRKRQFLTGDLLKYLGRELPDDAYARLGVTLEDLYGGPQWNFLFGQASLRNRVGIYSFARFDVRFYDAERPKDWRRLLLLRSCKVLAHETGHMFGIHHCTYRRCVMNGSNHEWELDSEPLHLCPVDLRKLYYSIGFDVIEHYRGLLKFSKAHGFDEEARWLETRIQHVTAP
jgi:archaemetzincin